MKQGSFIVIGLMLIFAGCNNKLPDINFPASKTGVVNYLNHRILQEEFEAAKRKPILSFVYERRLQVDNKDYLAVYKEHNARRVYFHLLITENDKNSQKLGNASGYRGAVLQRVKWEFRTMGGKVEMVYKGMSRIID